MSKRVKVVIFAHLEEDTIADLLHVDNPLACTLYGDEGVETVEVEDAPEEDAC